ncbi:hypothetical protein [Caproiciproducens faecalis]|uniref:Uncharacterized protein n=1 Tax=Caproiciproducens faecalis TaxID=2820301 RepID=A0ABS7DK11_9FIRM|nr:hypothetical protein [Caproiciproducens faecalis]MBW7571627.1 hypothetical protein [Caproiciproducens faecalis]
MGTVKGCINENCIARQKKTCYKKTDEFCSKCGNKLSYVCADCFKQLPDDSQKYCITCAAKRKDTKDTVKNAVGKIGGGVFAVGGIVLSAGKVVADVIRKK